VDDGPKTPARTPAQPPAARAKPPLFRHPQRVAIVGAGLFVVVALIVGAIGSADTSNLLTAQRQPKEVQGFGPQQDAIVSPTTPITVDLKDDLVGEFTICGPNPQDCTPIPFDQTRFLPGLGQVTFKPGDYPGNPDLPTDITSYPAGPVTVHVAYRLQGTEDILGTFTWSFVSKA
jgi:hypothetical protein